MENRWRQLGTLKHWGQATAKRVTLGDRGKHTTMERDHTTETKRQRLPSGEDDKRTPKGRTEQMIHRGSRPFLPTYCFTKIYGGLIMNTIRLQFAEGAFYPLDKTSYHAVVNNYGAEIIPECGFDTISPRLVRRGYKISIVGYEPKITTRQEANIEIKTTKQVKTVKNPCSNCYLKGLCDSDECGRKLYQIYK